MTKDRKQSVSHFIEEQLTPLEQKFAEAKANRDAGVEPYKIVPVELWNDVSGHLETAIILIESNFPNGAKHLKSTLEKMKQL